MKKCKKCGISIGDAYVYCFICNKKMHTKKEEQPTGKAPEEQGQTMTGNTGSSSGLKDAVKTLNVGVWRIVNYMEWMILKQGENPKEIRDQMWTKSQDDIQADKDKLKLLKNKEAMKT